MKEAAVKNFIASAGIGPDSVDAELFINRFMAEMQNGVDKKREFFAHDPHLCKL